MTEENIKSSPNGAGGYLLWVKLKNDTWHFYYVGKAGDLESRLLEHLSKNEPNKCIKNNVQKYNSGYIYAKINNQVDRGGN